MALTNRSLKIVFGACAANFAAYALVATLIGGQARGGMEASGQFFVRSHTRLTHVSEGVFRYSLWHGRVVVYTFPFLLASGVVLGMRRYSERMSTWKTRGRGAA